MDVLDLNWKAGVIMLSLFGVTVVVYFMKSLCNVAKTGFRVFLNCLDAEASLFGRHVNSYNSPLQIKRRNLRVDTIWLDTA